jgi:vitamin B12/bleomycin/antimicrobial peptide transport system ATP-binding/permease protein
MQTDSPAQQTATVPHAGSNYDSGLRSNLVTMISALRQSRAGKSLFVIACLIALVTVAVIYAEIRLVRWNKPFLDALSRRDLRDFDFQLGVFGVIAVVMVLWNVALGWLGEMLKIKMREGLVLDLIHHWMRPGCASALAHVGPIGTDPVQRVHEDARHLTELSVDLGIRLLQASFMAGTFVGMLWALSGDYTAQVAGHDIVIHGYLVWVALAYSVSASLLSYWVGRRLVNRNAELSAREADFNHSLVRVNDNIDAISLAAGEGNEVQHLEIALVAVLTAMRGVVSKQTNLTWVTASYNGFTRVAPTVAAAVLYFSGKLNFAGLLVASFTFVQLQSSLRWFVDNFNTIAKWRATLDRVASFRRAMAFTDAAHQIGSRIAVLDGEAGKITLENLLISIPSGATELAEERVEIAAGEHVLIVADSAAGAAALLRVLAGFWPWGAGRIVRPRDEQIICLPRTTYLPSGTLREILAYPLAIEQFEAEASFSESLARLGMDRLIPLLDSRHRWDRVLSEDERHCVGLARAVLRSPSWLVIDQVLDLVHRPVLERILDVFAADLAQTGVIYIGREEPFHRLFTRILHMRGATSGVASWNPAP